ncbi:T6SS phospholipase effector Tle1-like catalytic domain-containing protein [Roseateles chitosanitabidus]|uniref:T6SS phospholipase effector Tle1-like catalytic domain-containing protein n=1 Tax=Roseateles chitosanitabidus TaxID=65048 RepID=UPI00083658DE|nr:DUF2235 domain-containing protein [Roseateles chitosanitabidus]
MEPTSLPRRNLVLCCDGTNNTLTGGYQDTNVLKLFGYLRGQRPTIPTLLYYDPGVGSPQSAPPTGLLDWFKRTSERVAGLASGQGVYDNIGEGYAFLMREYDEHRDDRIFCFGFSRGAFTARAIVGMVNLFGILRPEHRELIPTLIRIYFSLPPEHDQAANRKTVSQALARSLHRAWAHPGKAAAEPGRPAEEPTGSADRNDLARQVRHNFACPADIHWVGVWDTVESVGLPPFGSRTNPATATFADKPHMLNVRHALAFDEHRWPFLPRVYDTPCQADLEGVDVKGRPVRRTIRQCWFPGVHCDVGGSYPMSSSEDRLHPHGRTGLADASLQWMINEAAAELGVPPLGALSRGDMAFGMPLPEPFPGAVPLRHDALHDTPIWALAGMTVRRMTTERVQFPDRPPILVDVEPQCPPTPRPGPSVWDQRRSIAWVIAALALAWLCLALSGWNLRDRANLEIALPATPLDWVTVKDGVRDFLFDAPRAAIGYARLQADVVLQRSLDPPTLIGLPGLRAGVVWGMVWDLLFLAMIGYLLARLSSRVFTWAAGWRKPHDLTPWWLLALGWLPAVAVGTDAAEDLLVLAAMAMDACGLPTFAWLTLCLMGLCSVAKLAAWALALAVFGGGRALLAVWPTDAVGKVGRKA